MMNRRRSGRAGRESKVSAELVDSAASAQAIIGRDVLDGNCTLNALKNCSTHHLESLLLKVINLPPAQNSNDNKPVWWPDDVLAFNELDHLRFQVRHVIMSWHSALAEVLESCVRFYSDYHPVPRKRSLMLSRPTKRQCIDDMQPVVLLKDVLESNYPVLGKDEFMGFLKLQKCNDNEDSFASDKTDVIDNLRYSIKIPFSSAHGRKVLVADRYALNERLFERKLDWTNAYLRAENLTDKSSNALVRYNVSFNKKKDCDHVYNFPRRQQRQRENSMEGFRQAFCRPVHVFIKRINMQPYLVKRLKCRRVSVMIDKRETDKVYNKKHICQRVKVMIDRSEADDVYNKRYASRLTL